MKKRQLRTRKLLSASAGAAGVTFLLCGPIACNLVPPPPCAAGEDPCVTRCEPANGVAPRCGQGGGVESDGGKKDGG